MKPVHPILVHFPIALLVTSVVSDGIYFFTSAETLRHAGWWMLLAAAVAGIATVAAGLFDMSRATLDEAVHESVHRHMWIGIALFVVICGLTFWRWTFYSDPAKPLSPIYLDFGLLGVALAAFQGWLGGELVYSHGVFVKQQEPKSTADGKKAPAQNSHSH